MSSFIKLKQNRIYAGITIDDSFVQLSYCNEHGDDPETLGSFEGGAMSFIPLLLYRRFDNNQWFYGFDAAHFSRLGHRMRGTPIDRLLSKACNNEQVSLSNQIYSSIDLLALFLRRCIARLSESCNGGEVYSLMITVNDVSLEIKRVLTELKGNLHIPPERIYIQNYSESCFWYVFNQKRELWMKAVSICDFTGNYPTLYRLDIRGSHSSVLASIDVRKLNGTRTDADAALDDEFLTSFSDFYTGQMLSSIFLCGNLARADLSKESVQKTFAGKRTFLGNNLFSKGAAYACLAKNTDAFNDVLIIGDGRMRVNIGLKATYNDREEYIPLCVAGTSLEASTCETNIIVHNQDYIHLIFSSPLSDAKQTARIVLAQLPHRKKGRTRLHIKLTMKNDRLLSLRLTDMGCGVFSPATGLFWEEEIKLG